MASVFIPIFCPKLDKLRKCRNMLHMETYINLETSDTWKEFEDVTDGDESSFSNEEDSKDIDM